MAFRLTRGEYWILNLVIQQSYPISILTVPNPGEVFNRQGHGLTRNELIDSLECLFEMNWIQPIVPFTADEQQPESFRITRQWIIRVLDNESPRFKFNHGHHYILTAAGASVWESFAQPECYKFLNPGWVGSVGERVEIIGATKCRVAKYFSLLYLRGTSVLPGSVEWDSIKPWECTYWKTLPEGHRVNYLVERDEEPPSQSSDPLVRIHRASQDFIHLEKWYEWS